MSSRDEKVLCPSAPQEWHGATIFGVVLGTPEAPRVGYLEKPQPASEELLGLAGGVPTTQVMRISAPCAAERCANFISGRCGLIDHIVEVFNPVAEALPPCRIRANCRWWAQHGREACRRCPQIVTDAYASRVPEITIR